MPQRVLSATSAGTVQLAIPVLSAIGAVLLLDERFTATLTVAAALVGAGMWLARVRPERHTQRSRLADALSLG